MANSNVALLRYIKVAGGWRRCRVHAIRRGRGWDERIDAPKGAEMPCGLPNAKWTAAITAAIAIQLRTLEGTELLDGATSESGRVFGTYVHGIFDNDLFRHGFIEWARASLKLAPADNKIFVTAEREARINRWADNLRGSLRLDLLRNWIQPAASSEQEAALKR